MSKNAIRIVAIVLAALMFIGVFAGAIINSFAVDSAAAVLPTTGERSKIVPVIIVVAAILIAGACFAVPKFLKKNGAETGKEDGTDQ